MTTFLYLHVSVGPGSVDGIKTHYELVGPGIESGWGEIFRTRPDKAWAHPVFSTMGIGSFPGVQRHRRGFKNHPYLKPKLKNEWSLISTPPRAFMACSSVTFTFSFYFYIGVFRSMSAVRVFSSSLMLFITFFLSESSSLSICICPLSIRYTFAEKTTRTTF
jgi:hypothetical protein